MGEIDVGKAAGKAKATGIDIGDDGPAPPESKPPA